jgi:hypothetical protein
MAVKMGIAGKVAALLHCPVLEEMRSVLGTKNEAGKERLCMVMIVATPLGTKTHCTQSAVIQFFIIV